MSADSFRRLLKCIREENGRAIKGAKTVALKHFEGIHKQRIFVDGLDESGSLYGVPPITRGRGVGVYSVRHGLARIRRGRQVRKKDLVFRGNLIRNIQVGTHQGDIVYGFVQDAQKEIAEKQEGQMNREIFNATNAEAQEVRDRFVAEYAREIRKCARNAT